MQAKSTGESSPVPRPCAAAGFESGLVNGPVENLCQFFGLGPRVAEALAKLKCRTGRDLSGLSPNAWYHVSGEVTGRRILLLWKYLRLRQKVKAGDAAGPSSTSKKSAVGEVAR